MKTGRFLIVNEPTAETVDRNLKIPAEFCDIFPAQVYIPKLDQKMAKGFRCVVASLAQIVILGCMTYFFSFGYLAFIPIEIGFFALYGKEHCFVLKVQMFYLIFLLQLGALYLFVAFLPESSGIHKELSFMLPNIPSSVLAIYGLVFGLLTCLRLFLLAQYYIHLFYSNLRDKFETGKVVLQPY